MWACVTMTRDKSPIVYPPAASPLSSKPSSPVRDQVDVDMFDAVVFDGQHDPGDAVESRGPVVRRNHGIGSSRLVGAPAMMRCARGGEGEASARRNARGVANIRANARAPAVETGARPPVR